MILKCFDGPMNGAIYHLDKGEPNTNRKPDGLWFNAIDEYGRNVQHRYKAGAAMPLVECNEPLILEYHYEGQAADTDGEVIEPWCNTAMDHPLDQPLALHEQQDLFNQMGKWLTENPTAKEKVLLRPEIENVYRMQATVVALQNEIFAGDTAIRQLECGLNDSRPIPPDAVAEPIRDEIKRIMGQHPLTTTKLTCASCGEVSSNPGQFLPDGRWVCTEDCRKELAASQSYDDLAASGGIVDAP